MNKFHYVSIVLVIAVGMTASQAESSSIAGLDDNMQITPSPSNAR